MPEMERVTNRYRVGQDYLKCTNCSLGETRLYMKLEAIPLRLLHPPAIATGEKGSGIKDQRMESSRAKGGGKST